MEKELDPVVIKATQTSLGKYVKRPPLTEKLLKKPPFRFLHDIVTSVLKTTGFFEGLFEEEELISENVKDRENKIVFLNKVITVVGWTIGKSLSVKPSKIVAGQEPEKTNELLQCIAHALDKKLSSVDAVKRFKEGPKATKTDEKKTKDSSKSVKKPTESNKLTSKSNEKLISQKKESSGRATTKNDNDKTNTKTKQKERNVQKNESPPKKSSQQSKAVLPKKASLEKQQSESNDINLQPTRMKYDAENDTENRNKIAQNGNEVKFESQVLAADTNADLITHTENNSEREEQNLNSSYTIADNGLNSSLSSQDLMETENIKSHQVLQEEDVNVEHANSIIIEQHIISEEPSPINKNISTGVDKKELFSDENKIDSADNAHMSNIDVKEEEKPDIYTSITKSPSKVKTLRPQSVRPSSSRPGAPRPRDKHDNILVEAENIMVGKVNIIAENAPNEEEEDTSIIILDQDSNVPEVAQDEQEQIQGSLNEHGHLVQQILDSQKEYSQKTGKTEIVRSTDLWLLE
ncbi:hypothetical protein ABMA27_007384 [Loxostege sticticalis]|uniref:TRAF3-interacting protein 1 N-terminal domain-containing protein n=1 Tax=Loxostege sticticalis TaxID=481309 RepID=A0ABR3HF82_LOXSC